MIDRRFVSGVLVAFLALAATTAGAQETNGSDPPHWYSSSADIGCGEQCHTTHDSLGGGLTQAEDNVTLCQSCHNDSGLASELPLDNADLAIPGHGGNSHAFGTNATNATYGAQPPTDEEMSLRVMDGAVVCSTCHNQHASRSARGGTSRISDATRTTALGSTGTVTSQGTFTGPDGYWYLAEIDGSGSQTTATFRWSKDNGTSWMATAVPAGDGAPVALDAGVEVVFTGGAGNSFQVGERWEFYGAFPFLRAALDTGDNASVEKFCRDCHREWVMTHDSTGGTNDWDGNFKSHPVGIGLNANGKGYDRSAPLDGDGSEQGVGDDGNPTNDLALDSGGRVQCLSCHGVHYADSNTLTVDGP